MGRGKKSFTVFMASCIITVCTASAGIAATAVYSQPQGQVTYPTFPNYSQPPYMQQQQGQTQGQGMYNGYNAMQGMATMPPGSAPGQQQQAQGVKYIYKGGINETHPLVPEELPQRIYHNCPCRNYESTY